MSSVVNQQYDRAAIEAIVRKVLSRLPGAANAACANSATNVANVKPCETVSSIQAQQNQQSFECDAKVITMETLRGKLNNIKTLRVKPKTIVTPAVRDELRDRNIRIAFDLGSANPANGPATILLGTTCNATGNSLRDQLVANGTQVQLHVEKSVAQLAAKVSNKIASSMPGLIVTDQPYTAACSANRNSNVRAVVVGDPNELRAANAELNPNCVVIKQGNEGQFNLAYVLNQFT